VKQEAGILDWVLLDQNHGAEHPHLILGDNWGYRNDLERQVKELG
jgi:hypothetical protein